jgi:23S rRNA (guanine2445-N2)-methyltransferase / 23S rRNA (guanine2069-N7)-methyltransferase
MRWIWQTLHGLEPTLAAELEATLGRPTAPGHGEVRWEGTLAEAERALRQVRVATHVLLELLHAPLASLEPEHLYEAARAVPWGEHLTPTRSFLVHASVGRGVEHTPHFVALKIKDAVVDAIREQYGDRPSVALQAPDLTLRAFLRHDALSLSLEIAAEPAPRAPQLRRSLLAATLLLGGWPQAARDGLPLVDPLAGDGALIVEALRIALDQAPDHLHASSPGWSGHDPEAALAARRLHRKPHHAEPRIYGLFSSEAALAQVDGHLSPRLHRAVTRVEDAAAPPDETTPGLVCTAPALGHTGHVAELGPTYEALGNSLRRRFPGWAAQILAPDKTLLGRVSLKPSQRHNIKLGEHQWFTNTYRLFTEPVVSDQGPAWRKPDPESEMFANRLRKNLKKLRRWADDEGVTCYRLYDADIPEYNLAIDWYEGEVHVQEYSRPPKIDEAIAERRLRDALTLLPDLLTVSAANIHLKVRRKGGAQYERSGDLGRLLRIGECGLSFWINLTDYLDTGIFLDQRDVRAELARLSRGRRFLNLFAYTCTATVYAASAGARSTLSVDLSSTYLQWGRRNLEINNLVGSQHRLQRADCMEWLRHERGQYDIIYIAPPTFSRSRSADTFDVQRDHVALLHMAGRIMARGGQIWFSNPFQRFQMDRAALADFQIDDMTEAMMPLDFDRRPFLHTTWRLTRLADQAPR